MKGKILKENKGFTLVELIVVMVLIAMIAALTVRGILAWRDWADFNRENEYAESLFIAAQNQLNDFSANGRLETMQKAMMHGNNEEYKRENDALYRYTVGKNWSMDTSEAGGYYVISGYTENEINQIWNSAAKKYRDRIVSIRTRKGDYSKYLDNVFDKYDQEYWVYEIVSSYIYDPSILNNAAICIEFTPADGQVFSVAYSSKNESFIYSKSEPAPSASSYDLTHNANPVKDKRSEENRRKSKVGYYDVEHLYKATKTKLKKPSLSDIKLYNGQTLYLTYNISKRPETVNQMVYEICLLDTDKDNAAELKIIIDGSKIKNKTYIANTGFKETIPCKVYRYDLVDGKRDKQGIELGEMNILAWSDVTDFITGNYLNDRSPEMPLIHIVLDQVDYSATEYDFRNADPGFKDTQSFFRFGLMPDNVVAEVTGNLKGMHACVGVSNEPQNTCFEGMSSTGSQYTITNIRHFNNIRYIEALNKDKRNEGGFTFKIKNDIDARTLPEDEDDLPLRMLKDKDGNDMTFPSFERLCVNDTIDGADDDSSLSFIGLIPSDNHKISGLTVSQTDNAVKYKEYRIHTSEGVSLKNIMPTGLINNCYGVAKNITLDDVHVEGNDYTGGFFGYSTGTAENLITTGTCTVTGRRYVGGIAGLIIPKNRASIDTEVMSSAKMQGLVNNATVTGAQAIGGITGGLRDDYNFLKKNGGAGDVTAEELLKEFDNAIDLSSADNGINISQCTNHGVLSAEERGEVQNKIDKNDLCYMGGIAGYIYNKAGNSAHKFVLRECNGAPVYQEETIEDIFKNTEEFAENTSCDYVGGITGFNYGADIENCYSDAENNRESYVYGRNFIGGLVGLNLGNITSDGINKCENNNKTAGIGYVGGIAGINAAHIYKNRHIRLTAEDYDPEILIQNKQDEDMAFIPDTEHSSLCTINGYVNKAPVYAQKEYAGGITGYNAGTLTAVCNTANASPLFEDDICGDYIGGISGYNNGHIDSKGATVPLSVTCTIKGKNYIGGIVGYNDSDGTVRGYTVETNSRITGTGCFTGGIVGFNSSAAVFDAQNEEMLSSRAGKVDGGYFVGKDIGGNIFNEQECAQKDINISFKNNNSFGSINGRGFIGGHTGYILTINNEAEDFSTLPSYDVNINASRIIAGYITQTVNSNNEIALNKKYLDGLAEDAGLGISKDDSAVSIKISGEKQDSSISFGSTLTGDIYIGGVVGYSDKNTSLYISDIKNTSKIQAERYIKTADERGINTIINNIPISDDGTMDYKGEADDPAFNNYSYAGGIIGKVNTNTTIDNCQNSRQDLIETKGTYIGGLCEINCGHIINCHVYDIGDGTHDYIGGLCGLNRGEIKNCSIINKTISGRNVVGGFAAENMGVISDNIIDRARIRAGADENGDGIAGTYAGINTACGMVDLGDKDLKDLDVVSEGSIAGGVVGLNRGFIKNRYDGEHISCSGSVTGDKTAGGIIGLNDVNTEGLDTEQIEVYALNNLCNNARVTAVNGDAGGITGRSLGSSAIIHCVNSGVVTASRAGNAGGITSENQGLIKDCKNTVSVTAPNGSCSGITAVNQENGILEDNSVEAPSGVGQVIVLISKDAVGAITAFNYGRILGDMTVNKVRLDISGINTPNSAGFIAGQNGHPNAQADGFTPEADQNAVIEIKRAEISISTINSGTYSGGIAGSNYGRINIKNNIINNSTIELNKNNNRAGGITGINEGAVECDDDAKIQVPSIIITKINKAAIGGAAGENKGIIRDLPVVADINGRNGDSDNAYGGIAGINSGYITSCRYDGILQVRGTKQDPAFAGGIAGINTGEIENCMIGVDTDSNETRIISGDSSKTYKNPDTTVFAYIGGIAGENSGTVRNISLYDNSTDEIGIIGFAGCAGGIVGINRNGAKIESDNGNKTSTPQTMKVEIRNADNKSAAGGVIGYNYSSKPVSDIENHASVESIKGKDSIAGGVVGVSAPDNAERIKFSNVSNYGDIHGYYHAGGIAGVLRYTGFSMEGCENYGKICSEYKSAGGIVALAELLNSNSYFTGCNNHGEVTTKVLPLDWVGITDPKDFYFWGGASGFLGECAEATGAEHIYFNDCVNTGIVYKDWQGYPVPDNAKDEDGNTIRPEDLFACNVGNFVGFGHFENKNNKIYWHFDTCRNYNNRKNSTEGFIGTSSYAGGEYFTNCLDAGGEVMYSSANSKYSPFFTHKSENVSMYNSFYINGRDNVDAFDEDAHGTYFTFSVADKNGPIYYDGERYTTLKSPELFLTPPNADSDMAAGKGHNIATYEFDITNDSESTGMSSFNVYLWNRLKHASDVVFNYDVYAEFVDLDNNKADSPVKSISATHELKDSEIKLEVPSGLDPHIKRVVLHIECTGVEGSTTGMSSTDARKIEEERGYKSIYLRGFTWTPVGSSKEAACTYLSKKYNKEFTIESIKVNTSNRDFYFPEGSGHYLNSAFQTEVLGINCLDDEMFYLDKSNSSRAVISIKVDDIGSSKDIGRFYFYPRVDSADGGAYKYQYDYRVAFYDKNGNKVYNHSSESETDWIMPGYTKEQCMVTVKNTKLTNRVARIDIEFGEVRMMKVTGGSISKKNKVVLSGFAWSPKAELDSIYPLAPSNLSTFASAETDTAPSVSIDDERSKKLIVEGGEDAIAPRLYYQYNPDLSLTMDHNNPVSEGFYEDQSDYFTSAAKEQGSNSRIRVKEDLDPKFLDFVERARWAEVEEKEEDYKLEVPDITITLSGGYIIANWDRISDAYRYELYYRIYDEADNEIYSSEHAILSGDIDTYYIERRDEWEDKGYSIVIYIQSKAANGTSAHDSDWNDSGEPVIISKKVLPTPKVHLELTADNKMVAVLDNRDEYETADGSGEYYDCSVKVVYDGRQSTEKIYEFNIPVQEKAFSDECLSVEFWDASGSGDEYKRQMLATAIPSPENDSCSESATMNKTGYAADNSSLINAPGNKKDDEDYTGASYIPYDGKQRLLGFREDPFDDGTVNYIVQYSHVKEKDGFMRTDISVYDELLGLEIAVVSDLSEIGSGRTGTDTITTMAGISKELFNEIPVSSMLVRNYLEKSENELVHYGHDVVKDIEFIPGDIEGNKDILRNIKDRYYLGENGEITTDASVWDDTLNNGAGGLKPGYVITRNDNASQNTTYSIRYNATLNLAKKDAGYANTEGIRDRIGNDLLYYRYGVTYRTYTTPAHLYEIGSEPNAVSVNTVGIRAFTEDFAPLYYINSSGSERPVKTDYQESYLSDRYYDFYERDSHHHASRAYQDIAPVPIMDGGITVEDTDGEAVYTVKWDTFYINNEVWNNGLDPENDIGTISGYKWYQTENTLEMQEYDKNVANTWAAYATKTKYYENNYGALEKRDITNAYILGYNNNRYTVQLIGADDGREYLIAEYRVDEPVPVEDIYTRQRYEYIDSVSGELKTSPKYNKWTYKFVFKNSDLGSHNVSKVRIINNGSDTCLLENWQTADIGGLKYYYPYKDVDGGLCYFTLQRYKDFPWEPGLMESPASASEPVALTFKTNKDDKKIYTLSWKEAEPQETIGYLITIKTAGADRCLYYYVGAPGYLTDAGIESLQETGDVEMIDIKDCENSDGLYNAALDLSRFEYDTVLSISVKPLLFTGSEIINNTEDGASKEFTLHKPEHSNGTDGNEHPMEYLNNGVQDILPEIPKEDILLTEENEDILIEEPKDDKIEEQKEKIEKAHDTADKEDVLIEPLLDVHGGHFENP